MGLFNIFKRQPPLPAELPEALIEAAYRQDSKALASLCEQHRDEIFRSFPAWRTVPMPLRKDAAAQDRYCKGLIAIASFFEGSGNSSLIQLLMGDEADNPLVLWERDLASAQSLIDSGHAADAIALLHSVIERTQELSGDGVAKNMPRTLGSLGAAYFRAGDKPQAIEFTQKALEMCKQIGDNEGVRIYSGNIQHIQNTV
jgi:tetratricopeptide (TPR) repeat protein